MPNFGDDELAFYLDREDLPDFVDEVLPTYIKHTKIFILLLLIFLSTEFISTYLNFLDRENEISRVYIKIQNKNIYEKY
jgi:hypothetical protein